MEGSRETVAWDLTLLGKPTYCTLGFKPPGLGAAGGRAEPGRAECPPRGVGQGPESVRIPSLSIPLPLLPPASPATSPHPSCTPLLKDVYGAHQRAASEAGSCLSPPWHEGPRAPPWPSPPTALRSALSVGRWAGSNSPG